MWKKKLFAYSNILVQKTKHSNAIYSKVGVNYLAVVNSHLHIRDRFFTLLHKSKHIHFLESSVFWLSRLKKNYVHLCSRSVVYFCCHKIHHNSARPHSVILVGAMLQSLMCWWSLWYSLDLEQQVLKDKQMIIFKHTIWKESNTIQSTKLCPNVTLYHTIIQTCCTCNLKTSWMNVVKRQKFIEPPVILSTQNNKH